MRSEYRALVGYKIDIVTVIIKVVKSDPCPLVLLLQLPDMLFGVFGSDSSARQPSRHWVHLVFHHSLRSGGRRRRSGLSYGTKDTGRIGLDRGYSKLSSEEPDSLRYSFSFRSVNLGPICTERQQKVKIRLEDNEEV